MCPPARKPLRASAWNSTGTPSRLRLITWRWMVPTMAARAAASSMISWAMWPGGLRSTSSAPAASEPSALITDHGIREVSWWHFSAVGHLGQQQIGPRGPGRVARRARSRVVVVGHQTATSRTAW